MSRSVSNWLATARYTGFGSSNGLRVAKTDGTV